MLFTKADYKQLHGSVFQEGYPGYKPDVLELPNGDGKVDATKRYAHVASKYRHPDPDVQTYLDAMLRHAHREAERVAVKLGLLGTLYMPKLEYGALRVLEYPVGAGSELHTDFDLFTLLSYRNDEEMGQAGEDSPLIFMAHEGEQENSREWRKLQRTSPGMHIGEIGELVGMGRATPHYVLPEHHVQHSIVYFAIPDHAAILPTGVSVGAWLTERMSRARTYK